MQWICLLPPGLNGKAGLIQKVMTQSCQRCDHPDLCTVIQWCHYVLLIVWLHRGCDRKTESQLTASQGWLVGEGFRGEAEDLAGKLCAAIGN